MDNSRIDEALTTCRKHLSSLDDGLPESLEIEGLLVSSIVLLIVSHYEHHIADQFSERAEMCGDQQVTNFVKIQIGRRFRNPDLGKIATALGELGGECRRQFTSRVANSSAHASWDNIIRARHTIVHTRGVPNLTLRELEKSYRGSHQVLVALRTSLGLSNAG